MTDELDAKVIRAFGLTVLPDEPAPTEHYLLVMVNDTTRTMHQWQDIVHDQLCACAGQSDRPCDVLSVLAGEP